MAIHKSGEDYLEAILMVRQEKGYCRSIDVAHHLNVSKPSVSVAMGILREGGMVTTDEPGVYLEGKYGIRTENELVCHKAEKNEYGQFMNFENITYAPIDLDAIDPDEMTGREKKMLNDYHAMVYKTLSPYMTPEENEWLKKYTRAI